MARTAVVVATLAAIAALATSGTACAQNRIEGVVVETGTYGPWQKYLGLLDGAYSGALEVVAATDKTPARFWQVGQKPELRIVIDGESARVDVEAGEWRELRVGNGFSTLKVDGSAFVYAVQSAGGWVENWNLSVTKKDPDTLLVFLSFVAGGSLERVDTVTTEFAVGAMGELKRVLLTPDVEEP